jgi:hypothetical protein
MSDDTPTRVLDQPDPPASGVPAEKKSRRALILILILAALIVIAIVVIIFLLLGRSPSSVGALGTESPTPTVATPSPTPSATPTPSTSHTQAPPDTGLHFTGYSISPLQIDCSATAPASAQYLSIHWTSVNGSKAYFGVNTTDAQNNGMGWDLPPSGSDKDFPTGYYPYSYQCGNASMTYTITVVGAGGAKQSKTITVSRK